MAETPPQIGLSDDQRQAVSLILGRMLADEFALYTLLRKYHWNVRGALFAPLHALFEEQYDALAETIDELAERIRMLGELAPGTWAEFSELTALTERPGHNPDALTMVAELVAAHEHMIRAYRAAIEAEGDDALDVGTEDFFTGILQAHEKAAWMLRATAAES